MQKIPDEALEGWLKPTIGLPYGVRCALEELRTRRAADLTAEEVSRLVYLRDKVLAPMLTGERSGGVAASDVAVITKLLEGRRVA